MSGDYVVYAHINPINGEVFYIGAGRRGREKAQKRRDRSKAWKDYVATHELKSFEVSILFETWEEVEAAYEEQDCILQYREQGHPLVNVTNGGEQINRAIFSGLQEYLNNPEDSWAEKLHHLIFIEGGGVRTAPITGARRLKILNLALYDKPGLRHYWSENDTPLREWVHRHGLGEHWSRIMGVI